MRRNGTVLISALLVVLGVVVIARTVQAGVGGGLGLIIGGMLVAAGALRLWLAVFAGSRPGKARPAPKKNGDSS